MRMPLPSRLLLLVAALTVSLAAEAAASTLSGLVTLDGVPVPGAFVDVFDTTTSDQVAFAITDGDGEYSVEVPDGTYEVFLTPPPETGFGTVSAIVVVTGDTVLNFALTTPAQATLIGHLNDLNGAAMPNQSVQLVRQGTEISQFATTGPQGEFSFTVTEGDYFLAVSGINGEVSLQAPHNYFLQTGPFTIAGPNPVNMDFTMPVKPVTVHVRETTPTGAAVVGARISTTNALTCELTFGSIPTCGLSNYPFAPVTEPGIFTDGSGDATLYLFPTASTGEFLYSVTATPNTTSLAPGAVSNVVVAGNDTEVTITLVAPTIVTGTLQGGGAPPLPGLPFQTVVLIPDGLESGFSDTTDEDGAFSFAIAPGDYRVGAFGDNQGFTTNSPQIYAINSSPFSIASSQVLNLPLPVKQVTVIVEDAGGLRVPGTGISTSVVLNCELMFGPTTACGASNYAYTGSPDVGVTDGNGVMTLWLFPTPSVAPDPSLPTSYQFTAFPPAASGQPVTTIDGITFTSDTTVTITLATPVVFTGTLRGGTGAGTGAGIPNQMVELVPDAGGLSVIAITDDQGAFTFNTQTGSYHLNVFGDNQNFSANSPQFYTLVTSSFSLSADTNFDLPLPVYDVNVQVRDGGSNPIANVGLTAFGPLNCELMLGSLPACGLSQYIYDRPAPGFPPPPVGVTDVDGNLTLWLFPTPPDDPGGELPLAYGLTATPLADSGFDPATAPTVTVEGTTTQVIVLQAAHAAPVTTLIITAPNPDGTYPDPVTIDFSVVVHPDFALDQTLYEVDGGGLQVFSGPFTVGGPGPHVIRYFSTDTGGVAESAKFFNFEIETPDTIPPTTTATVTPAANANGWHRQNVLVELNAVDDPDGSGVASITYSITGAQATSEITVPGDAASITITTEGVSVLTFFATDNAGNIEAAQTLTIRLDKTAPEMYSQFDPVGYDIQFFGRDAGSGVPAGPLTPVSVVGGPNGTSIQVYEVADQAGNTLRLTVGIARADKQLSATIVCLKYNSGSIITPAANLQHYKWKLNANQTLRELEQVVMAGPKLVTGFFTDNTNQTIITKLLPLPVVTVVKPGVALIRLATLQGALKIEF